MASALWLVKTNQFGKLSNESGCSFFLYLGVDLIQEQREAV
jgi:hypothetical protein